MDHLTGGPSGAVASDALTGGAKSHRGIGLVDGRHHVRPRVDEGAGEVVGRRCGIGWFAGALAFCVERREAHGRGIGPCGALGSLVDFRSGGLGLVGHEERARGDRAGTTLELPQGGDAVVEELEGFGKFVGGDLVELATGEEKGVLGVPEWVCEKDAQLVEHLDGP